MVQLLGGCGAWFLFLMHAPQRSLDAVRDPSRKNVWPFAYGLIRDAYGVCSSGYGAAQKFDGFNFAHAKLNHG
jgi:hypothetical protein